MPFALPTPALAPPTQTAAVACVVSVASACEKPLIRLLSYANPVTRHLIVVDPVTCVSAWNRDSGVSRHVMLPVVVPLDIVVRTLVAVRWRVCPILESVPMHVVHQMPIVALANNVQAVSASPSPSLQIPSCAGPVKPTPTAVARMSALPFPMDRADVRCPVRQICSVPLDTSASPNQGAGSAFPRTLCVPVPAMPIVPPAKSAKMVHVVLHLVSTGVPVATKSSVMRLTSAIRRVAAIFAFNLVATLAVGHTRQVHLEGPAITARVLVGPTAITYKMEAISASNLAPVTQTAGRLVVVTSLVDKTSVPAKTTTSVVVVRPVTRASLDKVVVVLVLPNKLRRVVPLTLSAKMPEGPPFASPSPSAMLVRHAAMNWPAKKACSA